MAVSFVQKIRLALRGWTRRREEREQEFLRRNTGWGVGHAPSPVQPQTRQEPAQARAPVLHIDLDGLQAAYLDSSGQIAYYLDTETGDVIDSRDGVALDATRYKRVPMRGSEDNDRRAFIETLEPSDIRLALMKNVASTNFRSVLASDRATERAWYNFRNTRAITAIEDWLKRSGLR